jgi:hypothetical protein
MATAQAPMPEPFSQADSLRLQQIQQGLSSAQQQIDSGILSPQEGEVFKRLLMAQQQPLMRRQKAAREQAQQEAWQEQQRQLMHGAAMRESIDQLHERSRAAAFPQTVTSYTDPLTGATAHFMQAERGKWEQIEFPTLGNGGADGDGVSGATAPLGYGMAGLFSPLLGEIPGAGGGVFRPGATRQMFAEGPKGTESPQPEAEPLGPPDVETPPSEGQLIGPEELALRVQEARKARQESGLTPGEWLTRDRDTGLPLAEANWQDRAARNIERAKKGEPGVLSQEEREKYVRRFGMHPEEAEYVNARLDRLPPGASPQAVRWALGYGMPLEDYLQVRREQAGLSAGGMAGGVNAARPATLNEHELGVLRDRVEAAIPPVRRPQGPLNRAQAIGLRNMQLERQRKVNNMVSHLAQAELKRRQSEAVAASRAGEHQRQETHREQIRRQREEAAKQRAEAAKVKGQTEKERRQAYRHHFGAVSKDPAFLGKSAEEIAAEVKRRILAEDAFARAEEAAAKGGDTGAASPKAEEMRGWAEILREQAGVTAGE